MKFPTFFYPALLYVSSKHRQNLTAAASAFKIAGRRRIFFTSSPPFPSKKVQFAFFFTAHLCLHARVFSPSAEDPPPPVPPPRRPSLQHSAIPRLRHPGSLDLANVEKEEGEKMEEDEEEEGQIRNRFVDRDEMPVRPARRREEELEEEPGTWEIKSCVFIMFKNVFCFPALPATGSGGNVSGYNLDKILEPSPEASYRVRLYRLVFLYSEVGKEQGGSAKLLSASPEFRALPNLPLPLPVSQFPVFLRLKWRRRGSPQERN